MQNKIKNCHYGQEKLHHDINRINITNKSINKLNIQEIRNKFWTLLFISISFILMLGRDGSITGFTGFLGLTGFIWLTGITGFGLFG